MTKLLYLTDSYLKEFIGTIIEVVDDGVVLCETAFYPTGGGQPFDTGKLIDQDNKEFIVTGVKKRDDKIIHFIEGSELPEKNSKAQGILDWERRYLLMRTHTAMHVLAAVIWRDYGAKVTGGNMEPGKGRMDFELEGMERTLVDEIEQKINDEIVAARDISVKILPREEAFQIPDLIRTKTNLVPEHIQEIRIVEIKGLDLQADGGTHVANTKEICKLKITDYKSKGRINKRLVIAVED